MNENTFLKLLCSLPVILLVLYFIPFLGICLIIFRYFVYRNKGYYKLPILLVVIGLVLLIPKIGGSIIDLTKTSIPLVSDIIDSDIYSKLLGYSKLLITVGIIFFIVSYIVKSVVNSVSSKISNSLRNFAEQDLNKDYEIRKENDLKMQEKREKALNTHVVKCPYCGGDNMLTESTGTCKFCRRQIAAK